MSARLARAAFAFGLTVLLLVVLVMMLVRATDRPPAPSFPRVACVEDDPCWRCESMGNRQCGPLAP
jgi:hypothetical protein